MGKTDRLRFRLGVRGSTSAKDAGCCRIGEGQRVEKEEDGGPKDGLSGEIRAGRGEVGRVAERRGEIKLESLGNAVKPFGLGGSRVEED